MESLRWQGMANRMADETRQDSDVADFGKTMRERLYGRLLLIVAIGVLLLGVVGFNGLAIEIAILILAGTLVLAALVPETGAPAETAGPSSSTVDAAFADALRLFADAMPDPCILIDRRSVIVHCNPPVAEHFPGAVTGNPISYTLRYPALLSAIGKVRTTGQAETIELQRSTPTQTWYRAVISPLEHGMLAEDTLVITLYSLTEARRLESLRSDFIANASHELRTPLTSLAGFIDTLLGPAANDPEARERFLGLMRNQATRMAKLIEDLLSLSRIEMRQHMRPTSDVEIVGVVREVSEALRQMAEDAGLQLVLELPEAPLTVTGDRDELYEVCENLIENAIKYGTDGKQIEVAVTPVSGRQGIVAQVSVTDHGAGVAPEHVPRLTERFYRVDAESSRKKKGTGLGLAIVKHIVNRHQGQLTIRSAPGAGTRVEILLKR